MPPPPMDLSDSSSVQVNVSTSNAYEILANISEDVRNQPVPRKEHVPPIVLDGIPTNVKEFIKELRALTKNEFFLKHRGKTTHICTQSRDDHSRLVTRLREKSLPFHTYGFHNERQNRFVVHGLPSSFTADDVKEDICKHISGLTGVFQFSKNVDNQRIPLPIFVLTTTQDVTMQTLMNLPSILHHKVRIEKYRSSGAITMCFRCQRFNHTSKHCNLNLRCVRCGEEHDIKDCERNNTPVKCVNCGETHVASYRQCAARLEATLRKQVARTRPEATRPPLKPYNPLKYRTIQDHGPSFAAVLGSTRPLHPPPAAPTTTDAYPSTSLLNTMGLIREASDVFQELTKMGIPSIINELKQMVSELKSASSAFEKISVISQYAHLFDGQHPK